MKSHDHIQFFFLNVFMYFEREREKVQAGERQRERERVPSRLLTVSTEPDMGLQFTNREIMT